MHGASLRVTFPATQRLEKRICIKLGGGGNDGYEQSNGGVDARTNRHSGAVGFKVSRIICGWSLLQVRSSRDEAGLLLLLRRIAWRFIYYRGGAVTRRPCDVLPDWDGVPATSVRDAMASDARDMYRELSRARHRRDVPRRPKPREICRKSSSRTTPCDRRARTSGTRCYQERR